MNYHFENSLIVRKHFSKCGQLIFILKIPTFSAIVKFRMKSFIKRHTMLHQLLFCTSFCRCLRNLKIAVSFVKIWVRSSAWDFFPLYFFIYFINFPSAVRSRAPIQNFSIINFFLIEWFNVLWFWKPFKFFSAKSHHKYSKLNESMLKRFFLKQKTLNFSYKKNFMMLKFCMELDISTGDGKLIK